MMMMMMMMMIDDDDDDDTFVERHSSIDSVCDAVHCG